MASVVLPSWNEPYWAEREVFLGQFPNGRTDNHPHFNPSLNPNRNPNPNPSRYENPIFSPNFYINRQIHDFTAKTDPRRRNEPLPGPPPPQLSRPSINDTPTLNRSTEGHLVPKLYDTFHLPSYSRRGLKELKNRLISDLERVRALLNRIEARKLEFRPAFHSPQFRPLDMSHRPLDYQAEQQTQKGNQKNRAKAKGKNNQKLSGRKRAPLASGNGREAKRPAVVPASSEPEKVLETVMKKCKQILMTLIRHKDSWVFNRPVDVARLKLPDYYQVIKHPMDLGTIKSKFNKKFYKSPVEFAADVRLTFNNAMTYNPKGQAVHIMAESMLSRFEEMFGPVYQEYETEHRRLVAGKMSQINSWVQLEPMITMPQHPILLSSPLGQNEQALLSTGLQSKNVKLPKPKAKDPNKRTMSDEEKSKLGVDLQNIPQEKMEHMVHIVRLRNPHLVPDGDEIELDIENLDNETLWHLDRFVTSHKKALNEMKKQEFIENAILIEESPKSPVSKPYEVMDVEKNKKGDVGEEDVDIGEDILVCDFPPVEIEKDVEVEKGSAAAAASVMEIEEELTGANSRSSSSSGSSSSSDDSSSSDSDSGSESSSGSDSDEESVQSPYVEPGVAAA